jgi:cathepsin X
MATTSSLSDRIKIMRKAAHPEILLAPQVLINCGGGGSCNGGDPAQAYHYMATTGLPGEMLLVCFLKKLFLAWR